MKKFTLIFKVAGFDDDKKTHFGGIIANASDTMFFHEHMFRLMRDCATNKSARDFFHEMFWTCRNVRENFDNMKRG